MIEQTLFKALLRKEVFDAIGDSVSEDMFPVEFQPLWESLRLAHSQFKSDISPHELRLIHNTRLPHLSTSRKAASNELINNIDMLEDVSVDIAVDLLRKAIRNKVCADMVQEASDIVSSRKDNLDKFLELSTSLQSILLEDAMEKEDATDTDITFDVEKLEAYFDESLQGKRWVFNLPKLQEATDGLPPGSFGILAARPEVGKTLTYLSLCMAPGGLVEQGAHVHVWRNEEAGATVLKKAICTLLGKPAGIPLPELRNSLDEAKDKLKAMKGSIRILKDEGTDYKSMDDLEKYLFNNKGKVDVLVIDQLDKMTINDRLAQDRVDLRAIYIRARFLAKRYNCAIIAITQAGSGADGKLHYGYNDLDESKTSKAAEGDYIFCIGAQFAGQPEKDSGYRVLNFAKNKLKGPHAAIEFKVDFQTNRIMP